MRRSLPHRRYMTIRIAAVGALLVITIAACTGTPAGPPPAAPGPAGPTPATSPATFGLSAAGATSAPADGQPAVSFSRDVLPILQTNCTRCHGDARHVAGLDLNGYDKIMAYAAYGLVVPGDPADSILTQIIAYGRMPPGGARLPAQSLQTISDWIQAGAPNN